MSPTNILLQQKAKSASSRALPRGSLAAVTARSTRVCKQIFHQHAKKISLTCQKYFINMSKIFHQDVQNISPGCQRHITRLLKVAKNPTPLACTYAATKKLVLLGRYTICCTYKTSL